MRIKLFQTIIDRIRNKRLTQLEQIVRNLQSKIPDAFGIDSFIRGSNNKIIYIHNDNETEISKIGLNCSIKIVGSDNLICFYSSNNISDTFPTGLKLKIYGNNNIIKIYEPNFAMSEIYMENDNNYLEIQKTVKFVEGAFFCVEDGASLIIEKDCEIGNGKLRIIANGDYKTKHKIHIKEGTFIAHDTLIRNSDGQSLIDPETNLPLSEPQDIIIEKHVWIMSRCIILKGTELAEGSAVAANSLVNKKFTEPNVLLAGSSAKILRHNIRWGEPYGKLMRQLESKGV